MAGDGADVVDGGGHHQGGEFEAAAGAGLAGGVAAGGVAFFQALDDFFDVADVLRSGELRAGSEERIHDQAVQDADAEFLPVGGMVGGGFGHSFAAGVVEAGERPLVVGRCVEAERGLVAFGFDFFPERAGSVGAGAGGFGVEGSCRVVSRSSAEVIAGRPRKRRCVARTSMPGSLIETNIISTKLAGCSGESCLAA